jgi:hypothetical protein
MIPWAARNRSAFFKKRFHSRNDIVLGMSSMIRFHGLIVPPHGFLVFIGQMVIVFRKTIANPFLMPDGKAFFYGIPLRKSWPMFSLSLGLFSKE